MKRFEWLDSIVKKHGWTFGAEIGTGCGKTAKVLLKNNPKLKLVQVAYYPNLKGDINYCTTQKAHKLWAKRIRQYRQRVRIFEMMSHEAVKHTKDNSFDFVFIDADHSYEHCLEDIKDWYPKVKQGCLISGHDYEHLEFPGVKKAVRDFFGDNYELTDDRVWYSWKK